MSFLDIIKGLFCGKKGTELEVEKPTEEVAEPVTKEKPDPIVTAKPEPTQPAVASTPIKKQTAKSQIPEDSTLRRHYLTHLDAEKQAKEIKAKTVEATEKAPEPVGTVSKAIMPTEKTAKLQVPQDATLKRHFISALKTEIEANMPARPTDSALKRHYDAIVQAQLDKLLA